MSSLPGNIDFPAMEEELCEQWKRENTFQVQDKLCLERGDEVRRKPGPRAVSSGQELAKDSNVSMII